jgi:hypothetical protein
METALLAGGTCIALNLSGEGPRKMKWRAVVLKNVGITESSVKNLAEVPVAPHHCDKIRTA